MLIFRGILASMRQYRHASAWQLDGDCLLPTNESRIDP